MKNVKFSMMTVFLSLFLFIPLKGFSQQDSDVKGMVELGDSPFAYEVPVGVDPAKYELELGKKRALSGLANQRAIIANLLKDIGISNLENVSSQLTYLDQVFASYEAQIQNASEQSAIDNVLETYYALSPHPASELAILQSRIELPKQMSQLYYTLQSLEASSGVLSQFSEVFTGEGASFSLQESGLMPFYQALAQQNEQLAQMSPEEKMGRGAYVIENFVLGQQAAMESLFSAHTDSQILEPLLQESKLLGIGLSLSAARVGDPSPSLKNKIIREVGQIGGVPFPHKKNVLLVFVRDWLVADGIRQLKEKAVKYPTWPNEDAFEAFALKRAAEVDKIYQEMSHLKQGYNFDICDVTVPEFIPIKDRIRLIDDLGREGSDEIHTWAYQLCKYQDPTLDLKLYDVMIVYPGSSMKGYSGLTDGVVPSLVGLGLTKRGFCGIRLNGNYFTEDSPYGAGMENDTIEHELGHCLTMDHAHAYACKNTYGEACTAKYINYGDVFDVMGDDDGYTASKFPHINCADKSYLQWISKPTQVAEGAYDIAALEVYSNMPQCLMLNVDQSYVTNPGYPCDQITIEYREPRTVKYFPKTAGGIALHCVSSRLQQVDPTEYADGLRGYFTALLDCTPNSWVPEALDFTDGLIQDQKVCDTQLGYSISFAPTNEKQGKVTIAKTIPCEDKDKDTFQGNSPEHCHLSTARDCDDSDKNIYPAAVDESQLGCNGKDDDCDGTIDGETFEGDYCVKCEDSDKTLGSTDIALKAGDVEEIKPGQMPLKWSDSCSGDILTEHYCDDASYDKYHMQKTYDCKKEFGKVCVKGACTVDEPCKDEDKDGFETDNGDPGSCILSTAVDCDDNDKTNQSANCRTCKDSDYDANILPNGGWNYKKGGRTIETSKTGDVIKVDDCPNNNNIIEYYCEKKDSESFAKSINISCDAALATMGAICKKDQSGMAYCEAPKIDCYVEYDKDHDGYLVEDFRAPQYCIDIFKKAGADCKPYDALIHPGAEEKCDGVDNDCNGIIDGTKQFRDLCFKNCEDSDGGMKPNIWGQVSATLGDGRVLAYPDSCQSATIVSETSCEKNLQGEWVIEPKPYDCRADNAVCANGGVCIASTPSCQDNDKDTFQVKNTPNCIYNGKGIDCNDSDVNVKPGANDICDGKDNNCDGVVDGYANSNKFPSETCGKCEMIGNVGAYSQLRTQVTWYDIVSGGIKFGSWSASCGQNNNKLFQPTCVKNYGGSTVTQTIFPPYNCGADYAKCVDADGWSPGTYIDANDILVIAAQKGPPYSSPAVCWH